MEVSYDKIIELIEMGLLSLAIFSLAIIKLISFCDKKKTNREQLELLREQAEFNNKIEPFNKTMDISTYNKTMGVVNYPTSYEESSTNSL